MKSGWLTGLVIVLLPLAGSVPALAGQPIEETSLEGLLSNAGRIEKGIPLCRGDFDGDGKRDVAGVVRIEEGAVLQCSEIDPFGYVAPPDEKRPNRGVLVVFGGETTELAPRCLLVRGKSPVLAFQDEVDARTQKKVMRVVRSRGSKVREDLLLITEESEGRLWWSGTTFGWKEN